MKIMRRLTVPTGDILVVSGQHGLLELVSLGDYGQHVNLNQGKPVPDGMPLMPLTEKWVVTVSTQYGCSMGCRFCDVPRVGPGKNATMLDLMGQINTALHLPDMPLHTNRLNIHFARMGEPTFNFNVLGCAYSLSMPPYYRYHVHPVVSTMMPKQNPLLPRFIYSWMRLKNETYSGNAGLQLSINSTDEDERNYMFRHSAHTLERIAEIMSGIVPVGRKITLNFAVADYTVDCNMLADLFSPDHYIVKLTPMHKTNTATRNHIATDGDYTSPEPYMELEDRFKKAGFDTLVFIASRDEDEGRITCGNAILSGSLPHKYQECAELCQ